MSSPTRFDGQWANGRRIDPRAARPFKSAKKAWPELCSFVKARLYATRLWRPAPRDRISVYQYTGKQKNFFANCCGYQQFGGERRNYIWCPMPSNWHNFTWLMLGLGWYRGGAREVYEREGPLLALGIACDYMLEELDQLQAAFNDPLPYFNPKINASLERHFRAVYFEQVIRDSARNWLLPDSSWRYWRYFVIDDALRSRIPPAPSELGSGSALGDLLG